MISPVAPSAGLRVLRSDARELEPPLLKSLFLLQCGTLVVRRKFLLLRLDSFTDDPFEQVHTVLQLLDAPRGLASREFTDSQSELRPSTSRSARGPRPGRQRQDISAPTCFAPVHTLPRPRKGPATRGSGEGRQS